MRHVQIQTNVEENFCARMEFVNVLLIYFGMEANAYLVSIGYSKTKIDPNINFKLNLKILMYRKAINVFLYAF